ncbi:MULTISPECIES: sulfurtransferase [Streptomyces]|uniref:sulfurtransferase n=1 Tax=Streptomyces TaxID=1883 RepID=UPI0004BDD107|nr:MULTISPECIES: sulfurtransferase [Streptomyces]KOG77690.1 3-mercaptopyruvate sulfurtransferase [Streptomyces griseus subsp. rhodochrous]KOU50447.1 3-mercaptopyruvate sulfurtransferase [Streptomyces sp. MMG1522]MBD3556259.1 sulfurtransferase [Streptomyces sp. SP18CM02]
MKPIITASACASESAGPRPPVLLDVRWRLGGPHGRADYEAGHLPGAVFVDLDQDLASPAGDGGRHPLPDPEAFGAAMRRAGVGQNTPVVVYDGGQGWAAARAWWLLRWAGHRDVRVLDGGLAAWTGDLSTDVPHPAEGDFRPKPGALPTLDADSAAAFARSGLLLDARAAERYRGDVEPIDRVGGHIPGAVSAPTDENTDADGRYLPAEQLAARFAGLGAEAGAEGVGVYCGSGVSGAHQVLALEIAGLTGILYPGSWSEWSADPSRPVATGPEPQ